MKCMSSLITALVLTLAALTPVAAQTAPPTLDRPASIGLLGGLSAGSGDAGGSIGLNLAFDVTDRIGVEARSMGSRQGSGQMGMEATGTMLFTIARTAKAAPYAAIGGGVYHTSFDLGSQAMFGAIGSQYGPGTMMTSVAGSSGFMMGNGTVYNVSQMPAFYANRLGQMTVPANGSWGMRSFTDPALTVGGGIRFDVGERLYVRPDIRALMVFGNGDRLTLSTMTLALGYRF